MPRSLLLRDRPAVIVVAVAGAGALATGDPRDALVMAALSVAWIAAVDRRQGAMLGAVGLATGVGPSALIALPFFLGLAIARRAGAVAWAIGLAAALAGFCASSTLPLPYANHDIAPLWRIIQALPLIGTQPIAGLAWATTIGFGAAFAAWMTTQRTEGARLFAPALVSVAVLTCVLPMGMAGGTPMLAMLALAVALHRRDREGWVVFAATQAASVLLLLARIAAIDALAVAGLCALILVISRIAPPLLRPAANDNPALALV
ncbi:MAG: hypothetical protein M3R41_01920 [Pseudomonadota bacterium]|nr:hypothetical protein [Pseudomonadota bacterium]